MNIDSCAFVAKCRLISVYQCKSVVKITSYPRRELRLQRPANSAKKFLEQQSYRASNDALEHRANQKTAPDQTAASRPAVPPLCALAQEAARPWRSAHG